MEALVRFQRSHWYIETSNSRRSIAKYSKHSNSFYLSHWHLAISSACKHIGTSATPPPHTQWQPSTINRYVHPLAQPWTIPSPDDIPTKLTNRSPAPQVPILIHYFNNFSAILKKAEEYAVQESSSSSDHPTKETLLTHRLRDDMLP